MNFIEQLEQDTPWAPPDFPSLTDPAWKTAFERGGKQQRANIANAWVWRLHTMIDEATNIDYLSLIAPHARFYAQIAPYIDGALHVEDYYVDMPPAALKSNERHSPIMTEHMGRLWKNMESASLQDVVAFAGIVQRNEDDHQSDGMLLLARVLLWDIARQNPATPAFAEAASSVSLYCGLEEASYAHPYEDSESQYWQKIALCAYRETRFLDGEVSSLIAQAASIPLKNRLLQINTLLNKLAENIWTAETLFRRDKHSDGPDYGTLRAWFPELATVWSITESLGTDIHTAMDQAIQQCELQATSEIPPSDIQPDTGSTHH